MHDIESDSSARIGADHAYAISQLKTQFDIFRFLKRVTESWGLKAFMVLNLPPQMSSELSRYTVITNWPAELLHQYDSEGLLAGSNVLRELKRNCVPLQIEPDFVTRGHEPSTAKTIIDLFDRFEMAGAIWFPVQDPTGLRGAVSFSGKKRVFTPAEMAELFYLAAHVFGRLAYVRSLDSRVPETLTDREIDCLNWTAAGKTSAEIAEILVLSEHTVNHYLNRATKKLDTVNRTQAVAKALRVGLIK
jgi:DNA-binding CsgD family transcriptional regulator